MTASVSESFTKKITKIYTEPFSKEVMNDFVCGILCDAFDVSAVAMLLYKGNKDLLVCEGRYIHPENEQVTIKNDNPVLKQIFENIQACEFIYAKKEENNLNCLKDVLHEEYLEYTEGRKNIDQWNFMSLFNDFNNWKDAYKTFKEELSKESYQISNKKSTSISGTYFYNLLNDLVEEDKKIGKINIKDLKDEDAIFSKYFFRNLLKKLGIDITKNYYYVGLPLQSKNRYFGILRFMLPKNEQFDSREAVVEWVAARKVILYNTVNILSLHLESNKYFKGYRKLMHNASISYVKNREKLEEYLKEQCTLLAGLVNCKGALVRLDRSEENQKNIRIFSDTLDEYVKLIDEDDDIEFLKHMGEAFPSDSQQIAVHIKDCFEKPFPIDRYEYDSSKDKLVKKENEILENNPGFLVNPLFQEGLKQQCIKNVLILKIPHGGNNLISFLNSEHRQFTSSDVEILSYAVYKIGLELKLHYDNTKQRQFRIIDDMHKELERFLKREENKVHDFNVSITALYLDAFKQILKKILGKFTMFESAILWDCVSEVVPEKKDSRNFVFKNWKETPIQQKYFLKDTYQFEKSSAFSKFPITESEFKKRRQDYLNKDELHHFLDLYLKDEYDYFDIPIFGNARSPEKSAGVGMNSLITIIYNKQYVIRQHDNYIKTNDFAAFIRFFSSQVSIAWNRLIEGIATAIRTKIDSKNQRLTSESSATSIKNELCNIADILVVEFKCDLCCLFLENSDRTNLELIASNINQIEVPPYHMENDKSTLTINSYLNQRNYRVVGRESILRHTESKRLKLIESLYNEVNKTQCLAEHWLSVVIKLNQNRTIGLIKLFQMPNHENIVNNQQEIYSNPFSEFETNLLQKIQSNIFHVIEDYYIFEARDKVIRNVVHQLVSPLNALINHCKNIRRWLDWDEKRLSKKLKYISFMAKMAAQRARSFQTLLDLIEDKLSLKERNIYDFRLELVNKAIDYQPYALADKGITVHVIDRKKRIPLQVDLELFNHVITNLIDNAIKYSFDKEEREEYGLRGTVDEKAKENIIIDLQETSNEVMITVSNWGLAIKEKDREQIFKRDYRAEDAVDFFVGGNGIGLYLAREIIKKLHGDLDLVPQTHPYHTVFKITLPKK